MMRHDPAWSGEKGEGVKTQFDIGVLPQGAVEESVQLMAAAEELGFGGVWVADSQSIFRDAYVTLALGALRTRRLMLATGVTNPVTRHPAAIACSIATIDEMSGGRAVLGIGTGFSAVRTLGLKPASLKSLEEATHTLRALMACQPAVYAGKEIRMTWPARSVPIYFAASGPKSLHLAGRIADGVLFQVGSEPALVRQAIERVHAGAREAGRDPKDVKLCVRLGCSVSHDRQAALEEARPYAAAAAETVFQSNPEDTLPPDLAADLKRLQEHYNYYQHVNQQASHGDLVTDRIVEAMVVAGTPEEVIPRFRAILGVGVDRVVIPLTTREPAALLRTLAEEVIPQLT
ncbi:MAG TPA: LLM class flavin-dependent oxidoreductase [Terriglobales bacterium]|nr:LLM class flavin-dependent oxidoreductase [Terriglobales bacterium]